MSPLLILALLALLMIAALPNWPYSREWGFAPSGVISLATVSAALALLIGYS